MKKNMSSVRFKIQKTPLSVYNITLEMEMFPQNANNKIGDSYTVDKTH